MKKADIGLIGLAVIIDERAYEEEISTVPIGDLEYYEHKNAPILLWVCFPIAFVIYASWVFICQVINYFI